MLLVGCRQESDNVLNYAHNDNMAFRNANSSFAGKFDVLWEGMSTNYGLWDYEYEHGLDWDQVYDEYRPKFAALDSQQTEVTDAQLKGLLDSVVAPLHDGHLAIILKNHVTGNSVLTSPGSLRVRSERGEEYQTVANKKISIDYYQTAGEMLEFKTANTNTMQYAAVVPMRYLTAKIDTLTAKQEQGTLTPAESDTLTLFTTIADEIRAALSAGSTSAVIAAYNRIVLRYEYLHIPGLEEVDSRLNEYALNVAYGLFKGNIAYFGFDHFKLTAYLNEGVVKQIFGTPSASTQAVIDAVKDAWTSWFNAIQAHQTAGDLGGVIIDIRSNGGGYLNDYQYVIGSLLPSGGYHSCNARLKRGPGRYDYSPVLPQYMSTLEDEHVTVSAPVVVLCNCASVSMAEHTAYGAKVMENGTLIGTRTFGGFSALSGETTYSDNYSGYVGIQGTTPVFCYIPQEVALTLDDQIVEGYGFAPDIEIAFDAETWNKGAGPDNQLDRALQFIRTGN